MFPALFAAYPQLRDHLPHRLLGSFPTPLERLHGLLPASVELWVKREDLAGGRYGGNKVRKLEFLLADARLQRPSPHGLPYRLLTYGAYGSHHVLATGLYGRQLGHAVEAVVYPQPITTLVHKTVLAQLGAGVRLWPARTFLAVPWQRLRAQRADAAPLLAIAPGGSSPRGTLGWVSGGLEIAAQVQAGAAPRFDAVYAALGSCGMATGLWLGLGEAAAELVAVRVVPWPVASRAAVYLLAQRTAALLVPHLRAGQRLPPRPRLRIDGRFISGGYGRTSAAVDAAVARAARCGLLLEPTYTGKALAALLCDADAGKLNEKRVLFIHSYDGRALAEVGGQAQADALPDWLRRRLARPR